MSRTTPVRNRRYVPIKVRRHKAMGGLPPRPTGLGKLSKVEAHHTLQDVLKAAALPERQREVLELIADGLTTKAQAAALGLSPKTVEGHRAHLMRSLLIWDVAGLTRFAVRSGVVAAP